MFKHDEVFPALADPTRRAVLQLLRTRGVLTAGEIAAAFGEISRPGVSRHLRVLRSSGLVRVEEVGREWHYRLEPGPLREMQDEWLAPFAPFWQQSLRRLKRRAESDKQERRRRSRREALEEKSAEARPR